MTKTFLFLPLIFLIGCQQKSEIDKCMDAEWELHLIYRDQAIKSKIIEKTPLSKEWELSLKQEHRFKCLKAYIGKDLNK
jgi:hypothetical protein